MNEPVLPPAKRPIVDKAKKSPLLSSVDAPRKEGPCEEGPCEEGRGPSPEEFGGPKGPEPTRYGDWEQKGRCTDF